MAKTVMVRRLDRELDGVADSRRRRADAFVALVLSIDAASRYFPGDRDYHD